MEGRAVVQRDYILRLIEQFGQFWAALVRLRQDGHQREALALIDQGLRQFLGLDAGAIDALSADELIGLVGLGYSPRLGRGWLIDRLTVLGLLLREEGEARDALGDRERGDDRALKALQACLAALADGMDAAPKAAESIEPLLARLAGHDLPPAIIDQLWRHYERAGQFAKAEDWLFTLLDDTGTPDDLVARGLAFYERLGARDDRELWLGNLPREEVAAGEAELRARRDRGL